MQGTWKGEPFSLESLLACLEYGLRVVVKSFGGCGGGVQRAQRGAVASADAAVAAVGTVADDRSANALGGTALASETLRPPSTPPIGCRYRDAGGR